MDENRNNAGRVAVYSFETPIPRAPEASHTFQRGVGTLASASRSSPTLRIELTGGDGPSGEREPSFTKTI